MTAASSSTARSRRVQRVEPGGTSPRRVGRQLADRAVASVVGRSSAASSSRKNGLPPLRSSRRSRSSGVGSAPSSWSTARRAASSQRVEVEHDEVVAARARASTAPRARAGPWRPARTAGRRMRSSRWSTRSSTRWSAQCSSDSTSTIGRHAASASKKFCERPAGVVQGAGRVDVRQRVARRPSSRAARRRPGRRRRRHADASATAVRTLSAVAAASSSASMPHAWRSASAIGHHTLASP